MPDGTSSTSFTLTDAADILTPYVERERTADQVRKDAFDREAQRCRGLSVYLGEPPRPRTEDELRAAAQRTVVHLEERRATPKGKAYAAIAKAARICALNGYLETFAELRALEATLDRGDGGQGRAMARVVYAVGRTPEGDARGALTALASEIAEHVRGTL